MFIKFSNQIEVMTKPITLVLTTTLIFIIIITNSTTTFAKYSCQSTNGTYSCSIPLSFKIQQDNITTENETILPTNLYYFQLQKINITGTTNSPIEINLNIENKKTTDIELEYYAYIYSGSKCISCNLSREENLKTIILEPNDKVNEQIYLKSKEAGNFSFKVKYKETKLVTWKEIIGKVIITSNQNSANNTNNIENNTINKTDATINTNNEDEIATDSAQIQNTVKLTNQNDTRKNNNLSILNTQPKYVGLNEENKINLDEKTSTLTYISKQKFLGNYIFIFIACGAIIFSIASLLKT